MNEGRLILRKNQLMKLKRETKYKKIVYFGAHIGWGKTTTVLQYLDTNKLEYEYISAKNEDFFAQIQTATGKNAPNIVIDDVHLLIENGEKLTEIIAQSDHPTKFYIIGRSTLPTYLKAFYTTRQLVIYDSSFFALSTEELNAAADLYGISLTQNAAEQIREFTKGWLLGTMFTLQNMKDGEFTDTVRNTATHDMFEYFDQVLFNGFSDEVRKFLLNMGHLPEFTKAQATMICGENDLDSIIDDTLHIGSFLLFVSSDKYVFRPFFHLYLQWKQQKECSKGSINRKYESTALYFALENDVANALKYYSLAENEEKVSELLIKNANKHAGNGFFHEVSEYYFSLPEEIVSKSVELMSALSIIYSLSCKTEESEYYYDMLENYEKNLPHTDKRKKQAQEKIAYLNIALPHRGIKNLIDIFKNFSMLISSKQLNLQTMSLTGNMPSLMNGGKDFCEWSKKDKLIYNTMRKPVCLVLGKSSDGLPEIGLAESRFEKNSDGNLTQELMLLNTGYSKSEVSGNTQLQFAALAVMARIYVTQGNCDEAVSIIRKFRDNILNDKYILKNVDAFLAYLSMLSSDTQATDKWFTDEAPDEYKDFFIMERYRYLIKIRIYNERNVYGGVVAYQPPGKLF